ncbi:transposase [Streptomyces sp. 7N604]|uniref:transposase n=1 Tax=Streptomyces sp. 7N604 TaxID=3457415 RepID=UPI003FD50DB4
MPAPPSSSAPTAPCAGAAPPPRPDVPSIHVHPKYELLTAARREAADPAWQAQCRRWRPPVERAIAWLVAEGNRRVPHRGIIASNIWLHHRAAAVSLRRLINLGLTRTGTTWHLTPATA